MASAGEGDVVSRVRAAQSLRRGVAFFRDSVATEGGYLWRYAADFSEREGELPAPGATVWVQPPGTPSVGAALLTAYELTGDQACLDAAREAGEALLRGQLESGGWDYRIEFAPEDRKRYAYRVDFDASQTKLNEDRRNVTTLDDNTTQSALRFLIRLDAVLKFQDAAIHEAVQYALRHLLAAQYPSGAWPQRFSDSANSDSHTPIAASYPDTWSRTHPDQDYHGYYTFNDNAMADTIELMFVAAANRAGDFIVRAQMPDPQPGWAQQYDARMQPAWARRFEPPSIVGREAQGIMRTLLRICALTGEKKFLEPLPRAIAYYRESELDDGRLARFYELKTNRPLYFTKDYQLTYRDDDLPTHYAFKSGHELDELEARYRELLATPDAAFPVARALRKTSRPAMTSNLKRRAAAIIAEQNVDGAWIVPADTNPVSKIPPDAPVISSRTFSENMIALARYIAAE